MPTAPSFQDVLTFVVIPATCNVGWATGVSFIRANVSRMQGFKFAIVFTNLDEVYE